ncbi:PGPGW domain-containing protein [Geodermatophilus amargosae]|uniref:PGPGW domain-containing protein n=1 Tax=Geodermatophilus amargosae TaxID=1296565 RepID=UPI0034DEAA4B
MARTEARTTTFTGNTVSDQHPGTTGGGRGATRCAHCTDGLGKPRPVAPGSWRDRVRQNPPLHVAYRIGVFVVGLLFVMLGVALTVLPGPLTIPPVLVGLWVWSTEFDWARRLFASFRRKAVSAWRHAKQHPASSLAVTVGGLAAAGVAFWAVGHFDLVDRATTALGLG